MVLPWDKDERMPSINTKKFFFLSYEEPEEKKRG